MKRTESKYTGLIAVFGGLTAYAALAFFALQSSALPMIEAVKAMA